MADNTNDEEEKDKSSIGKTFDALLEKVNDGYKNLTTITQQLARELSNANATMAGVFGQTQKAITGLREETAIALPRIIGLGGNLTDVLSIQQGIAKELQTNVITLGETTSDLFAAGKAVGVESSQLGVVARTFEDVGISTGLIAEKIQNVADTARRVGVNTSAVFDLVQKNLGLINKYGFENGVAGLTKMATQAAYMRVNMQSIENLAEKVFDPEGAIEMVATFQKLGAAVGDLADPFRLTYLAQEDMGELQNQVANMAKQYIKFNDVTKTFEVTSASAKRDLRELAKAGVLSYEDLIKEGTALKKLEQIGKDIRIPGIDDDTKKFIASVAQYNEKRGGFTIKVGTEEKLTTEFNAQDLIELQKTLQPVTIEDLAREQLNEDKLQTKALQEIAARISAVGAGAKATQDVTEFMRGATNTFAEAARKATGNVRGGIERANEYYERSGKVIMEDFGTERFVTNAKKILEDATKEASQGLSNIGKTFSDFNYGQVMDKYVSSGNKVYEGSKLVYEQFEKLSAKVEEMTKSMYSKPGVESKTQIQKSDTVVVKQDKPFEVGGSFTIKNSDGSVTEKITMKELMKDEQFRKWLIGLVKETVSSGNYGALPALGKGE